MKNSLITFFCLVYSASSTQRELESLPTPAMTDSDIKKGGFLIYIVGILYMIFSIREITSKYLIPSISFIIEKFHLKPESSGAILQTLATSTPEIFVMMFATYLTDNTLGFGSVLGSVAIRGMLFIGICCLSNSKNLELQWWIVVRDSMCNMIILSLIIIFSWTLQVKWWEGLILIFIHILYSLCLYYNKSIERNVKKYLKIPYDGDEIDYHPLPERVFPIRRHSVSDLKEFIPPQLNFKRGVLAKMIRNAQLQVVRSHSEKIMELRSKLKNVIYVILQSIEEKKRCCKQNRLERGKIKKFDGEENNNNGKLQEEIVSRIKKLESIRTEEMNSQQQVVEVLARGSRLKHYLLYPLRILVKFTIPNYKKYPKLGFFALILSFVWTGFFCFLLVWWMADLCRALGVPSGILGVIFIATGVCVPELVSILLKIMQGEGEILLSCSLRPNNFSMALGVGVSWFFYGAVTGKSLDIHEGLFKTELALLTALGLSYVFIGGFKWKLSKSLGVVMITFYLLFILFYLLFQFNQL